MVSRWWLIILDEEFSINWLSLLTHQTKQISVSVNFCSKSQFLQLFSLMCIILVILSSHLCLKVPSKYPLSIRFIRLVETEFHSDCHSQRFSVCGTLQIILPFWGTRWKINYLIPLFRLWIIFAAQNVILYYGVHISANDYDEDDDNSGISDDSKRTQAVIN